MQAFLTQRTEQLEAVRGYTHMVLYQQGVAQTSFVERQASGKRVGAAQSRLLQSFLLSLFPLAHRPHCSVSPSLFPYLLPCLLQIRPHYTSPLQAFAQGFGTNVWLADVTAADGTNRTQLQYVQRVSLTFQASEPSPPNKKEQPHTHTTHTHKALQPRRIIMGISTHGS